MAKQQTVGQKGFSLNWRRRKAKSTIHDGCFTMRPTQAEAFKLLRNKTHIVLNQPMGSGKSLSMCFISADKMLRDKSLRCIIAVPQTMIGTGFLEADLEFPNKKVVEWRVGHDVCTNGASKAQAVIDFLSAKPGRGIPARRAGSRAYAGAYRSVNGWPTSAREINASTLDSIRPRRMLVAPTIRLPSNGTDNSPTLTSERQVDVG